MIQEKYRYFRYKDESGICSASMHMPSPTTRASLITASMTSPSAVLTEYQSKRAVERSDGSYSDIPLKSSCKAWAPIQVWQREHNIWELII